jgi:2-polyprenyl-3-methyl-5-hydroxy-6-metoxy-1,4-benzoquinol methylase
MGCAIRTDAAETAVLEFLDRLLKAKDVRQSLDEIVLRVERRLDADPQAAMAWESVPLEIYGVQLPAAIRSSWVFVLRANTATGAERHPNSRQRMMSYRDSGDLQTRTSLQHEWSSNRLVSTFDAHLEQRWISIPPNVWHQAVVPATNWAVVSFHTAAENELIEERPDAQDAARTVQRRYAELDQGRRLARALAAEAISQGKPLDWFETLYRKANRNESAIPWADLTVNPNLAQWLALAQIEGQGRKALVVGCGLGDDAEALASRGFQVTGFDISETCIAWCRRRFPTSQVEYLVADLFSAPSSWLRAFDFVLEAYTLQVLPENLRTTAARRIADFVAADGRLLVITRGRDVGDDPGKMPWPLVRGELAEFDRAGLTEVKFEDYSDAESPPVRRFRIEYRRRR